MRCISWHRPGFQVRSQVCHQSVIRHHVLSGAVPAINRFTFLPVRRRKFLFKSTPLALARNPSWQPSGSHTAPHDGGAKKVSKSAEHRERDDRRVFITVSASQNQTTSRLAAGAGNQINGAPNNERPNVLFRAEMRRVRRVGGLRSYRLWFRKYYRQCCANFADYQSFSSTLCHRSCITFLPEVV